MSELNFKDRVVVVTGGAGGLGFAYARLFASRGARLVINDLSRDNADKAVKQLTDTGAEAIANYDSNLEGGKIIQSAMDKWGRVDVLINNAGILRDKSFKAMSDKEWDQIHDVHVKGSYACAKAAWPIFRKQKFGRVINTASAAGLYGNFGQANYSSAKMAMTAFTKTLAREGEKYNIHANCIAPIAASQMTATVMPQELLDNLKPEMVAPLIAFLCHESTDVNGQIFEAGAGWMGLLRWERTKGAVFKGDDTFTPASIKARYDEIVDYTNADHPTAVADTDFMGLFERSKQVKSNKSDGEVRYDGKTALVTGAGNGLGRAYARLFARFGANVVVNDMNAEAAEKVVQEIKSNGGKAVAAVGSVEDGAALVQKAVDTFGDIHIVVNNAGILRDKAFANATDADWDLVYRVHVRGTYSVCKAVWPIFQKQKYGRIVNTCSAVGLHGNFGQANYSTAKAAILGFTQTLAIEGGKYGILANTIVPNAGTAMTATIWPEEMVKAFSPDFIAPIVCWLCSEDNQETTREIFEASGGWVASTRFQRTYGYAFPSSKPMTPEQIKAKWSVITRFDDECTYPTTTAEATESIMGNIGNDGEDGEGGSDEAEDFTDPEDSQVVADAKKQPIEDFEYTFTERDVILYNLGIGATEEQRQYTFEGDDEFQALPTFGVIPQFGAQSSMPLDWLPNFSPMMLLHGEQYLKIHVDKIPTEGTLVTKSQFAEALDKGKAAAVSAVTKTYEKSSGQLIFENSSVVFIRGSGGFGGRKTGKDRGDITAANTPPKRDPDAVVEEKTLERQAAIYRLSGDYNPLHIDPDFAAVGGFKKPILHGLCSFGISGKHVLQTFGKFDSIKVRFAGTVIPGQTIVTSMWKEGNRVIFTAKLKETGAPVLSNAAATLV